MPQDNLSCSIPKPKHDVYPSENPGKENLTYTCFELGWQTTIMVLKFINIRVRVRVRVRFRVWIVVWYVLHV